MKIFADAELVERLSGQFAEVRDQDVIVVQLEQKGAGKAHLQDSIGLKIAIDAAKAGAPVVMLGWMPVHMYIKRKPHEWFAAMGHPNVVFLLPFAGSEEIKKAIEEANSGSRPADPLAVALYGVDQMNTELRVLHHDLLGAERDGDRMAAWLERAKAVFGDKSQEELIALTKESATTDAPGPLAGQMFTDVCVDVEGTLLNADGQLRADVLALAEEKANGGPITVWTGGDVYKLTAQIRAAGVAYKITSKQAMRGATVRVVIDDQPELAFRNNHGINYGEYVQL